MPIQDFRGAQKILDGLVPANGAGTSAKLFSALGRLKLEAGDIATAATYFSQSAAQPDATSQSRDTDAALLATAKGDWSGALALLEGVVTDHPDDVVVCAAPPHLILRSRSHLHPLQALNAMSVVLLCVGRLEEVHFTSALAPILAHASVTEYQQTRVNTAFIALYTCRC